MMLRSRIGRGAITSVIASAAAIAFAGACGSSSSASLGSKITGGEGGAVGDGSAGASGAESGGSTSLFQGDAAALIDSSVTIQADAACGETAVGASARKVNVLLVIDESGSMLDKPKGFTVDKWSALKTALGDALTAVKNDISFGLDVFPATGDPKTAAVACEMPSAAGITVPVAAGATSVPKILSAIAAETPGGGTPTSAALQRALAYFTTGAGASLQGDKYVLLATDGGPDCNAKLTCTAATCTTNLDGQCPAAAGNCCDPTKFGADAGSRCLDDGATTAQVAALAKKGIKTFVVGIPGSEAYKASLDAFAVAGGEVSSSTSPQYYAVSASGGTQGLSTVLASITKQLVTSCTLQLTSEPKDNRLLNVLVDGVRIPQTADGWHLDTSTSPPTINLLGSTCTEVETTGAQSVQVLFGCPPTTR
jgi:hypothetical protein